MPSRPLAASSSTRQSGVSAGQAQSRFASQFSATGTGIISQCGDDTDYLGGSNSSPITSMRFQGTTSNPRCCNPRNMNPEKAQGLSPELQSALEPLLAADPLSERFYEYNQQRRSPRKVIRR